MIILSKFGMHLDGFCHLSPFNTALNVHAYYFACVIPLT